ncbi:hypothetical protein BLA60_19845 [Actinophytocola xinjiangensis]|uniref:Subtilisin inhibitor domain-containing protein n=1 Tax=Actinophytocola xinjiangensis TaxID=485602 RepID=A0A7Z0WKZ9_9PSEU|nr:SSI family serine proteinase inhibitor [Actinophytocola xinjiangensis]OLF09423.1 hypothetical protein BLA60_19845 [Actinophytocola xinjiangensis]
MKSFRLGGVLAATAAAVCVAAAPATASIDPVIDSVPADESALTLLVWGPDDESRGVDLRCDPPSGDHSDPKAACDALAAAAGDFSKLTAAGSFACTMELRQVTAVAIGTWRGQTVHWSEQFSNPCVLRAHTGPLFEF